MGVPKSVETRRKNGTFPGWPSRKNQPASFAEKYMMSVFQQEQIFGWERELKQGKYFIDFAFESRKIAVEVDGRQHEDRVESDLRRDVFLAQLGWTTFRIKWNVPREKLHEQIKYLLIKLRG